jgi:hypothetical protein
MKRGKGFRQTPNPVSTKDHYNSENDFQARRLISTSIPSGKNSFTPYLTNQMGSDKKFS